MRILILSVALLAALSGCAMHRYVVTSPEGWRCVSMCRAGYNQCQAGCQVHAYGPPYGGNLVGAGMCGFYCGTAQNDCVQGCPDVQIVRTSS